MRRYVHIDTETRSAIDVKKAGFDTMAKNCEVDIVTWGVSDSFFKLPDTFWAWDQRENQEMPERLRDVLEAKDTYFVAFNAGFDSTVIEYALGYDLTGRWLDSGVYATVYGIAASDLASTGKVMGLTTQKQTLASGLMKLFCGATLYGNAKTFQGRKLYNNDGSIDQDYYDELRAQYVSYAIDDTKASAEIWVKAASMGDKYPLRMWNLDQKINKRGVSIAVTDVENMVDVSNELKDIGKARLRELCNADYEVANHAGFGRWLRENVEGWDAGSAKDDVLQLAAETEDELLKEACELKVIVTGTAGSKYTKIRDFTYKGKLHNQFRFNGSARTGRWSGSGVQLLNMARPHYLVEDNVQDMVEAARQDTTWWVDTYGENAPVVAAKGVRAMITPRPGYTFIDYDLNSIENVLAMYFTQDEAGLRIRKDGLDPYKAFGVELFDVDYDDVTKPMRQKSKPGVLGCTYGMAAPALVKFAKGMGNYIEPDFAKQTVSTWRGIHTGVVDSWKELDNAFKDIVDKPTGYEQPLNEYVPNHPGILERHARAVVMRFPSGRGIWYLQPQVSERLVKLGEPRTNRYTGETETHFMATNFSYMNNMRGKVFREGTHGGKLLGNTCQGIGNDIQRDWLLNADDAGLEIVIHVHDQIVVEARERDADAVKQMLLDALPNNADSDHWSKGWGVGASGGTTERFWK